MGYLNIPANGWPQLKDLEKLDKIAQQMENLPTFTSDDRAFLEALPAMPTEEGKRVLTAITDDQGDTELTYEISEVEGADIAPTFSESVTYSAGTLVYYDGSLYKFTEDHAAGPWDAAEVTPTSTAAEFIEANAAIDELKNTLSAHTVSGTTSAQLATAFNKLTASQQITSKISVHATDGSGCVLPYLYNKHYEDMYFDGNSIIDIQLDISSSSATLNKATYTFGSSTRTNTTLTIDNWTIYYFGSPIS